ncbi:MAG: YncE family protein [Anaerolineae bacterium]
MKKLASPVLFICLFLLSTLPLFAACRRLPESDETATAPPPAVAAATPAAITNTQEAVEPAADGNAPATGETVTQNGVSVTFTIAPFAEVEDAAAPSIMEGDYALASFMVQDAETQEALAGIRPFAWIALNTSATQTGSSCAEQVEAYLSGALTSRPDVDLNSYFILVMNNDATISVLDPRADVAGMTQLFDMILLNRPGEDWVMQPDGRQLFVTMPTANQIAVVDMETFGIVKSAAAGAAPTQIMLAPDGNTIWVGNDSVNINESGITVIDRATYETAAFIQTGNGPHDLAFSPDGTAVYITNMTDGTLSIIDVTQLTLRQQVPVGTRPFRVDVSNMTGTVYVANQNSGTISVIDSNGEVAATLTVSPGISDLALSPDGRWLFVTDPTNGTAVIFDTSNHMLTFQLDIPGGPDRINFSETAVYIQSLGSPSVTTIQLADLEGDTDLPVTTLPMGQGAPGTAAFSAAAAPMQPIADENAMLFVNPADRLTYYYSEGATAPLGSFQAHGRIPRAVQVANRSLMEVEQGIYAAQLRMPRSGDFQAVFFLQEPRVIHCFPFSADPNPAYALDADDLLPQIAFLTAGQQPTAGQPFTLEIELTDPVTGLPIPDVNDLYALASNPAGWSSTFDATPVADGVYQIEITVPESGIYYVNFAIPSRGAYYDQLENIILNAQP